MDPRLHSSEASSGGGQKEKDLFPFPTLGRTKEEGGRQKRKWDGKVGVAGGRMARTDVENRKGKWPGTR